MSLRFGGVLGALLVVTVGSVATRSARRIVISAKKEPVQESEVTATVTPIALV